VLEDLTDRQRDALEAAYRAGYFAWPRESTAEDVAESLDLTSPTLHSHLRKAESVILSRLLDGE
jgi:predicted DNA binding protein